MSKIESWGRIRNSECVLVPLHWPEACSSLPPQMPVIPLGQGRSYGDLAFNDGGAVAATAGLDRFIDFDPEQGSLHAQGGITLAEILRVIVPRGWFLPVTPGTSRVSLGGAIANDVHGKNHHTAGSFGHFITELTLWRSSGEFIVCSPASHPDLFSATIGGLGLTGLIVSAKLRLRRISTALISRRNAVFLSLSHFAELSGQYSAAHEYTVGWIDCAARGSAFGRGVMLCGDHLETEQPGDPSLQQTGGDPRLSLPELPIRVVVPALVRLFNRVYFWRGAQKRDAFREHFVPFFYPLDSLGRWNRLYGRGGFVQFQCVIPRAGAVGAFEQIFAIMKRREEPSYLAVLKEFGARDPIGMLSFPRPGWTLCLDFPYRGERTISFLSELHEVVIDAGGALYPAKDACMNSRHFAASFPRLEEFSRFIDPKFNSTFWRRVTGSQ